MRIEKILRTLPENTSYLVEQPVDIYYLTGLEVSTGTLVIGNNSFLLVDGRYFEMCKNQSPVPVFLTKEGLLFDLIKGHLQVDKNSLTIGAFLKLQEQGSAKGITLEPVESLVKPLRMIKDAREIQLLKEAALLGIEGYHYATSLLKTGIQEEEVAVELEYFWRKRGGQGVAFDPIIAFGANSAMPHYRAGKAVLKEGDLVLIDIGVKKEHYHSDMTRVVCFGEVPAQLQKMKRVVQESIQASLALLKPGVLIVDVDEAARQVMRRESCEELFTHSLGHGVGLDIHEAPWIRASNPHPLQEGMVITIEPGLYLPNVGGIRIEDTVVITKDGYENLTPVEY